MTTATCTPTTASKASRVNRIPCEEDEEGRRLKPKIMNVRDYLDILPQPERISLLVSLAGGQDFRGQDVRAMLHTLASRERRIATAPADGASDESSVITSSDAPRNDASVDLKSRWGKESRWLWLPL